MTEGGKMREWYYQQSLHSLKGQNPVYNLYKAHRGRETLVAPDITLTDAKFLAGAANAMEERLKAQRNLAKIKR
jgi:hypothetical protein